MMTVILIFLYLLAGYGHFLLLKDSEQFRDMSDSGKIALLFFCLLAWPVIVGVKVFKGV